jgi:glyoxylate reductase
MTQVFVTREPLGRAHRMLGYAFGPLSVEVFAEDRVIPREALLRGVAGADAILCMLTERMNAETFDAAGPQLRCVSNFAVGYDNIDIPEATRRGIAVFNTPDVLTETTADLAWALILAVQRRLPEAEAYLRAGRWTSWSPRLLLGRDVHGKTLGIFGLGRIGRAAACRAQGFNLRVLYHHRTRLGEEEERALGVAYVDKAALLAESDIVSIHCPMTPETRHAFSVNEFAQMKKTAILINTARGPIVDEAALAEALHAGEIAGAGMDVFESEPAVHPRLLTAPNALLLPHVGSATEETRAAMAELAATNLIDFLTRGDATNCVNRAALADHA